MFRGGKAGSLRAGSLSIRCGEAAGPFRLYGGQLLSWQKLAKPLAPAYGPALRSGSPPSGVLRGHAAYDLQASLHLASSAAPKGAAHLPPPDASARPPEVAICVVWTFVHEEQEQTRASKSKQEQARADRWSITSFCFRRCASPGAACNFATSGGRAEVPVGAGAQHPSALAEDARCRLAKRVVGRVAPKGAGGRGPGAQRRAGCGSERFCLLFPRKKSAAVKAEGAGSLAKLNG